MGYLNSWEVCGLVVRTDARGRFRLERIPSGAGAQVRVTPPAGSGYAIFDTRENALRDEYPIRAGTTDVEVALEKGAVVHLQVMHGGKPVPKRGLYLQAIARSRLHRRVFATTDAEGRADFAGMRPGTWDISVSDDATEEEQKLLPVLGVTVAAGDSREVEMGFDEGVLVEGVVRDESSGAPVSTTLSVSFGKNRWLYLGALKSDSAGKFSMRLAPEEYRVSLASWPHGKYRDVRKTIEVGASGVEGGRLELAVSPNPRAKVKGQLVDENGHGMAGRVVMDGRTYLTEADGRFEVGEPSFQAGAVPAYAVDASYTRGVSFMVEPEGEREFQLTMAPMATVTGTVVDARPGGNATGATVELMVRTENGMWASYSNMWKTELREDGSFRIRPVPTGCGF